MFFSFLLLLSKIPSIRQAFTALNKPDNNSQKPGNITTGNRDENISFVITARDQYVFA
jgi:hypothetical protein